MKPFQVERVTTQGARGRLSQLGARYDRINSARAGKPVYYNGVSKVWVTLDKISQDVWTVSQFKGCPC